MSFPPRNFLLLACCILGLASCRKGGSVFEPLTSSHTGIDFENRLEKKKAFGLLYYLYYYNGGGVAIGDIDNDGFPDIYFSANSKGHNKLYRNKGNFEFEDITEKAGVTGHSDWCTGVTMADINGDGLLDIYVCALGHNRWVDGHNELFINNGNGTFTESAAKYGLDFSGYSTQAVFFDYDHDGDLDCFLLNQSLSTVDNIPDTSARQKRDPYAGDYLFRNDLHSTGRFTDVSQAAGINQSFLGYGLGVSVADLNNDGWDDIYIGNDFHENDYYYVNGGNGSFHEEGREHFGHYSRFSMGNDIADYNNDGQPDIVTLDMLPPDEKTLKTYGSDENAQIYDFKIKANGYQLQYSRNCLQQNNGDGVSFSDVALQAGVSATDWSWCPLFADFDNDGKKDLFVSSGIVKRPVDMDYVKFISNLYVKQTLDKTDKFDDMALSKMPDGASHPFLFKGNGAGSFEDVSMDWGTGKMKGYFNGAAYADLDNDGRVDVVINSIDAPASILKNVSAPKNWLTVSMRGDSMNRQGIGAKVWLYSKSGMQFQELMLTRGFESSSEERLHFGLDSVTTADSLLVVWPDQRYQVVQHPAIDKQLTLAYKDSRGHFDHAQFFPPEKPAFKDVSSQVACDWRHKENDFNDFSVQYLIPHKESTRGPKIAVGDVNGDGLDDFYVCGARGQAGALMIQQPNGSFLSSDTALFNRFAVCEDVDAVFFDANGDGHPDLWVVSGGNEYPANQMAAADRLFLNDGKGHFRFAPDAFVQEYENKTCIAVADVDKDGDMDVFVGNLAFAGKYGVGRPSYLYVNQGGGKFVADSYKTIPLANAGMVTSAQFADINKDGWPDLIVAGEWMPVRVFLNDKGTFREHDIPGSSGLWQSLTIADVNGDGNPDILAGNWGHNSKLWSGKSGPLKLYVKDFDHNGSIESVVCYTVDGQEYPFLAKDELERSLPVLKKYYLTYSEVAGKTVQYIFYDLFKDNTEWTAEVLGSSCFLGDGKGGFTRTDLPDAVQRAPVFAVADAGRGVTRPEARSSDAIVPDATDFLVAGNFYGVVPFEGRYDALFPTLIGYDRTAKKWVARGSMPTLSGEFRDAKWLRRAGGGRLLVLAKNDAPLVFLTSNQQ